MTTTKRLFQYVGKNVKWFMDFLPEEVFQSLKENERINYREYRRYQKLIGQSENKIQNLEDEIEQLKKKIQNEKKKFEGDLGWKSKMKSNYGEISYLDKDFRFSCSVEFRKSKSRIRGDDPYIYLYSHVVTTSKRIPIYLGRENKVRIVIGKLYGESIQDDSKETLVDEYLKPILRPYSRYHIHKKGWKWFRNKTHNLQSVIDWIEKVGWDKVNDWGN